MHGRIRYPGSMPEMIEEQSIPEWVSRCDWRGDQRREPPPPRMENPRRRGTKQELPALRVDHRIFSCVAEEVGRMSRNGVQRPVHGVVHEVTDGVEHKAQPPVRMVVGL